MEPTVDNLTYSDMKIEYDHMKARVSEIKADRDKWRDRCAVLEGLIKEENAALEAENKMSKERIVELEGFLEAHNPGGKWEN